jgi:hypothetical protein
MMNFSSNTEMFSRLPSDTRAVLLEQGKHVNLRTSRFLCRAGSEPKAILFIEQGFVVEALPVSTGGGVAVSVIDCNGLPLAPHFLGGERNTSDWLVAGGTKGLLVPISFVRTCFYESEACRSVVLDNVRDQLAEKYRMSACGRLHGAMERFASFLLVCAGCMTQPVIPLTQTQLATMLGFTRSTIVLVATRLRAMGAIRYSRGMIAIANRNLLVSEACGCHRPLSSDRPGLLAA